MIRRWFTTIFAEVVREQLREQPLIVSYRAPTEEDVYEKGTMWKHGNDFYVAEKVTIEWKKI